MAQQNGGEQAAEEVATDAAEDLQEQCGFATLDEEVPRFPEWVESAWRLYCRGQRNWTALGKQFGVDYRTVQLAIRKFGMAVRAAGSGSGVDAWQEALTGHEEVLSEAWRIHANPDATNQEKLAALKVAQESIGQVAALNGVVTKRVGVEHSGKVKTEVDIPSNGQLARLLQNAADLARSVAGLTGVPIGTSEDESGGMDAPESED